MAFIAAKVTRNHFVIFQVNDFCIFFLLSVDLCSNGGEPCWLLGSTIPQYCGANLSPCPTSYMCLQSAFFGSSICCKQKLWLANDAPSRQLGVKTMNDDIQTKNELDHMANLLKQSSIFLAVDQPKSDGEGLK